MRILFTTIHSKNLVNLNTVYNLERHVSQKAECRWAGPGHEDYVQGESLDQTVNRLYGDDPPDWVVSNNAHLPTYLETISTKERNYKVAITLADLHSEPEKWVKVANNADAVLMRYLYAPYVKQTLLGRTIGYKKTDPEYYQKNIKSPILHFPWFTDPEIYRPQPDKRYDVVFLGAHRKKVYPLRHDIVHKLGDYCKENGWSCLIKGRPPGKTLERDMEKLQKEGYIVGDLYGKTVASSKVFIFGNSIFNYPLSKYFEIMGSGTMVMANTPQASDELGFIDGENFVSINKDNWQQKLRQYLQDDSERERIAINGYNHVSKNHSVENRTNQLLNFLASVE